MRYYAENALFSSLNGAVFSLIQHKIRRRHQYSNFGFLFFLFPNSLWRLLLLNLKKQKPWPSRARQPFLPSLEHVYRVNSTVWYFDRCSMKDGVIQWHSDFASVAQSVLQREHLSYSHVCSLWICMCSLFLFSIESSI